MKINSLLVLIAFLFIGLACVSPQDRIQNTPPSNSSTAAPVEPQWEYSESTDKMTSKTVKYASVDSKNQLEFDFPYNGGSTGTLEVRRKNNKDDVILRISKGQFIGNFSDERRIGLRFNEQKAFLVGYSEPSDNSSDAVFLNSESKIIAELKKASTLKVEVEFFREGKRVLEFNVKDFKW